ncbi:hypothetical protein, conserved [Babesia ovata]|uniref:RAP domain-containing protein n=1 Tax=Babesia ovata TaxID=189622 RepID=A0A2H6KAL2_9APIC|nr:uncharacterized protein BOVATA_015270 [Babesia ovata]GBE60034.1 hypothetical protein, conserved [Babesia ovata]
MTTNVTTAVVGTAAAAAARRGRQLDPLTAGLKELTFRELAAAAETLAKTKVTDGNLWSRLCDRLKPELKSVHLGDALRVVHALAKVPYKKVRCAHYSVTPLQISLMNVVEKIVLQRHHAVGSRAITQYFIDATRLQYIEPNTFQAVVHSRIDDLDEFSAFDLCFLLHVAAKLRLADSAIIDKVSQEILTNDDKYDIVCKDKALVAMLIRSLAFLQHRNELFQKLVYTRLPGYVYVLGPQEMCNVIFSLVVALQDEEYGPEVTNIVKVLLDRVATHLHELVDIEVNQLCISLFNLKHKLRPFDDKYQALLDNIVTLNMNFPPSTSKMQYKIARLLDDLKVKHKSEQRIGPYVMDYILPQLKVAIEVNGYSHFYHQTKDFHSVTRLKYQIVRSLGWKVLSVNYFDWKNRSRQIASEHAAGLAAGGVHTNDCVVAALLNAPIAAVLYVVANQLDNCLIVPENCAVVAMKVRITLSRQRQRGRYWERRDSRTTNSPKQLLLTSQRHLEV